MHWQCVMFSIAWVYRTAVLLSLLAWNVLHWFLSEVVSVVLGWERQDTNFRL